MKQRMARREFLKHSAGGLGLASAAPGLLGQAGRLAGVAQAQAAAAPPPSEQLVIGMIGTGDLGRRHHLEGIILKRPEFRVAAVCDVDSHHVTLAARSVLQRSGKAPGVYGDFRRLLERKDLDAVFVVTPDHWHAIAATAAMEAGLDVYCEKPLTLTVAEGRDMVNAARRYKTVFQTGSMQRSDPRFRQAVELVRNEKIGKLKTIHTYIGSPPEADHETIQTPPPELDWNFWLGPAPWADYFPGRCHYQFRWFLDYSGGKMTDWGAHHNDQAQWAMDMDESGPRTIEGTGTFSDKGPYDVPAHFEVHYTYANGVDVFCHSDGENGIRYEGTDGWIFVNRGRIEASDPEILKADLGASAKRVIDTGDTQDSFGNHYSNWIDCIKTRQRPICDVEVGHRSASMCHLGNIAILLGRQLTWDPAQEQFVNDQAANAMLSRPRRAPWNL